jgi:hypothetical protein
VFIGRSLRLMLRSRRSQRSSIAEQPAREQVKSAPNIELHGDELSKADESTLYHHYELNDTPPNTERGRRLARR